MEKETGGIRKRIFDVIQIGSKEDLASRIADYVIGSSIIINIVALYLGTFELPKRVDEILDVIEYTTLVIFIIEYILRVWTADFQYPKVKPFEARCRYICI